MIVMSFVRPYFATVLLFLLVASGCLSAASDKEPVIRPATFSPDGQYLVFHVDHADPKKGRIIYRILKDGTELTQLTPSEEDCFNPSYSPDGSKIVYAKTPSGKFGEQADLYIINSDGSNPIRLTSGPVHDTSPTFSPDGQRIYFVRARWFGRHSPLVSSSWKDKDIYSIDVDGSNLQAITDGWYYGMSKPSVSPDGKQILVQASSPSPLTDEEALASIREERKEDHDSTWIIPIENPEAIQPLRPNLEKYAADPAEKPWATEPLRYDLYDLQFSPNGKAIFFTWAGHYQGYFGYEIYLMDLESKRTNKLTDMRSMIASLSLSPDGKEMVFLRENHLNELWIVNSDGTNPRRINIKL